MQNIHFQQAGEELRIRISYEVFTKYYAFTDYYSIVTSIHQQKQKEVA